MKRSIPLKKIVIAGVFAFCLIPLITFVFWHVKADEFEKKASSSELISSNQAWVETKTAVPLTDDISFVPDEAGTTVKIMKNGDLAVDVVNPELLQAMVEENPGFNGMKEYRLLVAADRVADYLNNDRYLFPVEHGYEGFSNFHVKSGNREIRSEDRTIPVTQKGSSVAVELDLSAKTSDELAGQAVDALNMNVSLKKLSLDDSFATSFKTVKAHPKMFYHDFTVEKKFVVDF
ncbi:hypothetical protein MFLO_11405 [Listeria floridensis FSL S10-1187]|uniref:Regulatory protein YycH-like domain-containing protein n=1 Tax=Listeria floridensis FSL S10-1187 TaxID=1265817 RepID=A0ABP3AY72_9LIST|nr:hypothetical protein [Listeria floridensis]EUJ29188.1 hypothetical protein MFLO_11405 [Listeria floridensis FSL S10-1187]